MRTGVIYNKKELIIKRRTPGETIIYKNYYFFYFEKN